MGEAALVCSKTLYRSHFLGRPDPATHFCTEVFAVRLLQMFATFVASLGLLADASMAGTSSTTFSPLTTPNWFSTLSPEKQAALYWSADTEVGNASQWDLGLPWASGNNSWKIVTQLSPVHSGMYSISSTINTSKGESGVRWPMRGVPGLNNTLPDAYYSTWVYLPSTFNSDWFMLMQWKTGKAVGSDPVKSINLEQRNGAMYLGLYDFVGADGRYNTSGSGMKQRASIPFPTEQWVHLEAYYDWSTAKTGSVVAYQDGVEVFRQMDAITLYSGSTYDSVIGQFGYYQWAVNNYGGNLNLNPYTLYIDDAAISRLRLGAMAGGLLGDFDANDVVDAADYVVWRHGLGTTYTQTDYDVWRAHLGLSTASGASSTTNDTVPEPATLVLLSLAASLAATRIRRGQ